MDEFRARLYRLIFAAAAAYNIAFGLWAALLPRAFFSLFQLDAPRYPAIWACLGMVVGLYGVGYGYAAWRLDRAFPFIAIGLAGKILGPIGFVMAIRSGELPIRTFPLIVFDDLLWWLPFAMFLLEGTAINRMLKRTAPMWCAALHVIAAVATLLLLRGGSEAVAADQRLAYLHEHAGRWRAGWILWMIAALSLAGFYAWWCARVRAVMPLVIAALGLLCDFSGESIFIGWLPAPASPLHRAASLLTGGAGNGLYTIAAIILTVMTPSVPLRWLAWLAWTSGVALTIFTVLDIDRGVVISSGALMLFFIPWVVTMGRR